MSRWLVDKVLPSLARRTSRRGFLMGTAMVATAVSVDPKRFLLQQCTPIRAICGPSNTAAGGYSALCCTVNNGRNSCPPGTFVGGWWRADGSHYCCSGGRPGTRYYIDCNASCRCGCGGSHFCSSGCWTCRPHAASGSCDQRRVCWNVFRYGQCNTHVACSGPVACRVVTCTPPYRLLPGVCGTTSLWDNATADQTAPCVPGRCA